MIDVEHHVNATERSVGGRTLPVGEVHVVTIARSFATTVEDLWDACTNPGRIPRWFLPVSGQLAPGGRYQLEGNAGGTVQRCEPPRRFLATWEFGDTVNWIELRLSRAGEPARLELDHLIAAGDETWEKFGPGAVGIGWELALIGLVQHEAGGTIDPEAIAAWMGSPDYRRLVAESGEHWRAAQVAAGAEPAAAEAQARRNREAYGAGL